MGHIKVDNQLRPPDGDTVATGDNAEAAPGIQRRPRRPKPTKLTIKQEAYVSLLTSPAHPETFGNKTRSALAAGYGKGTHDSVAGHIDTLTNNPLVSSAIQQALQRYHLTIDDRASAISDIMSNPIEETTYYDSNNSITSKTIRKSNEIRLKAIRLLNNMDGTSSKAAALGIAAAKALSPLLKDYTTRMRAALNDPTIAVEGATSDPDGISPPQAVDAVEAAVEIVDDTGSTEHTAST